MTFCGGRGHIRKRRKSDAKATEVNRGNATQPHKTDAEKNKADARTQDLKETFLKHAADLWDTHEARFMEVLDDSESQAISLTFHAKLDFSESTAKLDTTIGFSQVVKDKRTADFDNPNQMQLLEKPVKEKPVKEPKAKKQKASEDSGEESVAE